MTISSSLNAGVAGLNAQAVQLATIADNIANSATNGYKRVVTDFHSMVVSGDVGAKYTAGGVRTTTARMIDERGELTGTTNATDIAVDGRGFLPVTSVAAVKGPSGNLPLSLATTGSFRPDDTGLLRTDSGLALMGWPALPDGTVPAYPRDSTAGLQPVMIARGQLVANPTTAMTVALNLPASATTAGASGEVIDLPVEYFGNLGGSEVLNFSFTPTVPGAGAANEWTMAVSDSAAGGAVVGEYVLTFDDTQGMGGRLATVTTVSGGAYDPATGGFTLTLADGDIAVTIGQPGAPGGMTQLASAFAPVDLGKNGAPVASLIGVEIDQSGFLVGVFDFGQPRVLYQIPLVDVPNPNGLTSLPNQTYQVSAQSGAFYLWQAGDGPVGKTAGFAREESTTDVAGELTRLIQTQRAYSSNAKVIQTVDEMIQETNNIKR